MARNLRKVVWLAIHPLPNIWGWFAVLTAVLTVLGAPSTVGLIVANGATRVSGISWGVATLLGVLSLLFLIAAVRLQNNVERLETPKRTPPNEQALIEAITVLEQTALAYLDDLYDTALLNVRREEEGEPRTMDQEKTAVFEKAVNDFKVQERIAGPEFEQPLLIHRGLVDAKVKLCLFEGSSILTKDRYRDARHFIRRDTEVLLEQLRSGLLGSG